MYLFSMLSCSGKLQGWYILEFWRWCVLPFYIKINYNYLHFYYKLSIFGYQTNLGNSTPSNIPPLKVFLTLSLNTYSLFLINSDASLFNGSFGFGSINKNINPKITALIPSTGFQSALKIFKHTFPYKSMFGWYI